MNSFLLFGREVKRTREQEDKRARGQEDKRARGQEVKCFSTDT
jgi:hypothetical protein